MKRLTVLVMAIVVGTLFVASSASAGCKARAEKGDFEIDNGDVLTNFTVYPSDCSGFCNGYVKYRIHYKNNRGRDHFYSGMAKWSLNTDKQSSADVVHKGYESHCSDRNLGPCAVKMLEVQEVSCFD